MSRFCIGDIVTGGEGSSTYCITNQDMIEGIVRNVRRRRIYVEVLKHTHASYIGEAHWVNPQHFKHVGHNESILCEKAANKLEQKKPMNILALVKGFYTLEAIWTLVQVGGGLERFRHSHERWDRDFTEFREQYNKQLAAAIYDYTAVVVAGEMRHGYECSTHYIEDYYNNTVSRDSVYRDCVRYSPDSLLKAGRVLFGDMVTWKRAYGGAKWEMIARAGLFKGKLPDSAFIDHCVDLTHNGSIYFDKGAGIFYLGSADEYKEFLDFKRDCDPGEMLKYIRSSAIYNLLTRAINLGIIKDLTPPVKRDDSNIDFIEWSLLTYERIDWQGCTLQCRLICRETSERCEVAA